MSTLGEKTGMGNQLKQHVQKAKVKKINIIDAVFEKVPYGEDQWVTNLDIHDAFAGALTLEQIRPACSALLKEGSLRGRSSTKLKNFQEYTRKNKTCRVGTYAARSNGAGDDPEELFATVDNAIKEIEAAMDKLKQQLAVVTDLKKVLSNM